VIKHGRGIQEHLEYQNGHNRRAEQYDGRKFNPHGQNNFDSNGAEKIFQARFLLIGS
jgi:hypothetical protein